LDKHALATQIGTGKQNRNILMQMPSTLLQILKTLDVKHVVAPDVLSGYDIQQ